MADFSSVVVVEVDEAGRPTSLRAFAEGDTIASSVITSSITQAVEITYDRSATWEAGGEATLTDAVSGPWQNTFEYASNGSADISNTSTYVKAASGDITSTSSLVTANNASWTSAYNYSLSAWQTSVDNSSTWQAGGEVTIPADVSGPWQNTYLYASNGSGDIGNTSAYVDSASGDIASTSGTTVSLSGTTHSLSGTSLSLSGSLGTSANWDLAYNDRPNNISISGTTHSLSGTSLSLSGSLGTSANWDLAYNDRPNNISISGTTHSLSGTSISLSASLGTSGNWDLAYNDRPNNISASGSTVSLSGTSHSLSGTLTTSNTAFLTGDTPTLSNNLDCSQNYVSGATQFRVRNNNLACFAGEGNIEVSAPGDITHRAGRSLTIRPADNDALSGTSVLSIFTPVRMRVGSSDNYIEFNNSAIETSIDYLLSGASGVSSTVFDNSGSWGGGGGGGSFEGWAIASAIMVTETSSVEMSGVNGDTVDAPKDGWVLTLDTVDEKAAWKAAPFTVQSAGAAINLGAGVNTTAEFNLQDVTINQTNGDFIQGDGYIIGRRIHASTELSAAGTITLSGAVSVSSTSSIDISAMPVPAPMIYLQMNIDGSYESAETNFADGVTPTQVKNRVDLLSWDNTNKVVDVSATGYYEVLTNMVLETSANINHNTAIYRNGAVQNRIQNMPIRSVNDPQDVGVMCCFYAEAGDTIKVTTDCTSGSNAIKQKAGSSLLVRRLF